MCKRSANIWSASAYVAVGPHACTGNKFCFMNASIEISCV